MVATYRVGVDVGGTNTDAVLIRLSPVSIIATHKAPTTADITTGITTAIRAVLSAGGVLHAAVACVIIGTTHFVNAVITRSPALQRVAVVRLCGGGSGPDEAFGCNISPFVDFPPDLRRRIAAHVFFCRGGSQISGEEIAALDEAEIEGVADKLVREGVADVVVAGIYSPLDAAQEDVARGVLLRKMIELARVGGGSPKHPRVTASHEISSLGFLARENAAILNATLRPLAERTIRGFEKAVADIFQGHPCALYLTQNDGSVLSSTKAAQLPIRMFNSGPTNSIRGGEFLWRMAGNGAGIEHGQRGEPLVVVDIGGTSSDAGLLLPNGMPRMSSLTSLVGGVRTNFALPAVESVGLGGGSVVQVTDESMVTVGPESVGLELTTKARLFGGSVLTATDIVVASSLHHPDVQNPLPGLGEVTNLRDVSLLTVIETQATMRHKIEELVDRAKIQKGDVDVLVVGGGAILIDTEEPLAGVRSLRTVKGAEVANAVGAAISRVSGLVDKVVDLSHKSVRQAQEDVSKLAVDAAIRNGAKQGTTELVEMTTLPIQYVEAKARILARAVGDLDIVPRSATSFEIWDQAGPAGTYDFNLLDGDQTIPDESPLRAFPLSDDTKQAGQQAYRPIIQNKEWILSTVDLYFISTGCKILGCGGGGDPYQEYLKARSLLERAPRSIRVVSADFLPPEAEVGWTGNMGSPEVSLERMEADECRKAHAELVRVLGIKAVDAFVALEIGGGNGLVNFGVAAAHGVPVIDADFMGRAYPTMWQTTVNVHGSSAGEALVPCTIASGDGTFVTMTRTRTDVLVDRALRAACVEMGCRAGHAGPPKPALVVQEQSVVNTVSLAWWIGRAVSLEKNITDKARRVVDEVGGTESAVVLAEGKIISVERILKTGHTYGVLEVDGRLGDGGAIATIRVPFKNENAYVEATTADGRTGILASVPDLIVVLDAETGLGVGVPEYKYGLRVVLLAIAASPRWTDSKRGLELGGPASMGFNDIAYVPIGRYSQPRSVIDEFS